MTTFSKFFQDHIKTRTCQTLIHPESCRDHMLKDILLYTLSNFKYFFPICIIPALIKIRTMNKERLRRTLEYYLSCSLIGTCIGYATNIQICFYRKLFGQFGFYTFLFLPSFVSAYISYLSHPRIINLFETSILQCVCILKDIFIIFIMAIETFFIMRRNIISRSIGNSRILQTWTFMLCSAIILHGKQLYNTKGFWLLKPNPKILQLENIEYQKCELHSESSCKQYLWDGMRKYFILGLSLDLIKTLMRKVNTTENQSKVMAKLKNFRIRSVALLTTYIGIYRFTHCWLKRFNNYPDTLHHITASFLAGFCYYLYPQSTLFSYALVQATRTIWTILQNANINTKNNILKNLLWFPYAKILFPLALGNMVHLIALRPKYASRLAKTIANGLTNNYAHHIQTEVSLLQKNLAK